MANEKDVAIKNEKLSCGKEDASCEAVDADDKGELLRQLEEKTEKIKVYEQYFDECEKLFEKYRTTIRVLSSLVGL